MGVVREEEITTLQLGARLRGRTATKRGSGGFWGRVLRRVSEKGVLRMGF